MISPLESKGRFRRVMSNKKGGSLGHPQREGERRRERQSGFRSEGCWKLRAYRRRSG